jgi:lipopolysaccharide/colanic/teichoic acid biosynthesis glycosyltransferase
MAKRALDLLLTLGTAPLWLPLLGVVALLVRVRLGAPVFFRQERPGMGGRPFRILKFRSMTDQRDGGGKLLPDAERLSRFGRWLRSSSLDELPELFNVIRGEMSLVGPRPLLMQYLPLYTERQARRHEVRPGLTGWAQVNGRNAITWEEKFELDVWYVENRTLWLDVTILLRTAGSIFSRRGISASGSATMPEFRGTNRDGITAGGGGEVGR